MWVQSIVLEYHRDISVFWFYIIYHFVTDLEFTACNLFQIVMGASEKPVLYEDMTSLIEAIPSGQQ